MKTKIINYNKKKARRNFVLFKISEIFGLFLVFFGFEKLGHLLTQTFLPNASGLPGTYFGWWVLGFLEIGAIFIGLVFICAIGILILSILKAWIKANWEWAKKSVEEPNSKIERLKEKQKLKEYLEIVEKEKDREKYGVCIGDEFIPKRNLYFSDGSKKFTKGKKYKIDYLNENGDMRADADYFDEIGFTKIEDVKLTKQKIPKKPKLNKKYIKEE